VRFFSEVMTGLPSIVMGLFIYTLVVLNTKEKKRLAGSLALACLMLPIVIRTTDQMLALVPSELREGSYALGSRRVRTIRTVVLRTRPPGSSAARSWPFARAAGETAPLSCSSSVPLGDEHQPVRRSEHGPFRADLQQRDRRRSRCSRIGRGPPRSL